LDRLAISRIEIKDKTEADFRSKSLVDGVRLPFHTNTYGGESRIRTLEGVAGGFTVRSHWPLGQPAKVVLVIRHAQITLITALGANQKR
jgi:hypothetical protein